MYSIILSLLSFLPEFTFEVNGFWRILSSQFRYIFIYLYFYNYRYKLDDEISFPGMSPPP